MAATKNAPLEIEIGDRNVTPVAAGKHIFQGAMVWLDASGYATPTPGAVFVGHAIAEANNSSGANGAISVWTRAGIYKAEVTLASVALTDMGEEVFASDDVTLSLTTGGHQVGKVFRYVKANTAVVEFHSPVKTTDVGSI
jgi:hypothetical protein